MTVVGCTNATGQAIPLMVIFDAQKLNPKWTEGEFPGTKYRTSSKRWMTTELFDAWFSEQFLEHAVSARPLLLLLYGHSTHYQLQVVHLAKDHGVIMLCLLPHTTHESQPLDCGVFGPLKSKWCNVCHTFFQKNPGRVITKFQFSALFSQAWARAISPVNIIAGFRTCDIYPFNPAAIKVPEAKSNQDNTAYITARPSSLLNETRCNEARQFAFPSNPTDSSHSTPVEQLVCSHHQLLPREVPVL